jgi:hypothetical protein
MTQSFNTKNNYPQKLIIVFGVLFFTYTCARAYLLSITWDEAFSCLNYISRGVFWLDRFELMSANNHVLNSLGGIVFTKLFGLSEFILRISSLIAHLFFLYYSAKLVLTFDNKWMALSGFLILNANPYLLDFFSLSRGYGLSIGFMMASVYYLYLLHTKGYKTGHVFFAIVFAELSVLGNLTMLIYLIALIGLICLLLIYNHYKNSKQILLSIKNGANQMIAPGVLILIFLYFIIPYSFELKNARALFMGGDNGFWQDSVETIIPRLIYSFEPNSVLYFILKVVFVLIVAVASIYVGVKHASKKTTNHNMFLGSLLLLFFMIIAGAVLQHHVLGTLYFIERAVLFLFILLLLIFIFLLNEVSKENFKWSIITYLFAGITMFHFLYFMNFKYVFDWKEDCETKEMLSDLEALKKQPEIKYNVMIGIPLFFESSINYYRAVNGLNWLNQVSRSKELNYINDYFFITKEQYEQANKDSLQLIKKYPITKNVLAKSIHEAKIKHTHLDKCISQVNGFMLLPGDEYSPILSYVVDDSVVLSKTLITFKADFYHENKLEDDVSIVFTLDNEKGNYVWSTSVINGFVDELNSWKNASYSYILSSPTKAGDKLNVYIWNPNKQQIAVNNLTLKVITFK